MDTLEHVQQEARGNVVREVYPVATRRVVLGFPRGDGISVWDRRLADHLRRRGREIPVWLPEHLAHEPPDPDRIAAGFEVCGFAVVRPGSAPALGHYLLICAEARPYLGRKLKSLSRRISRALSGRPRHRYDTALVRLILALHPRVARLSASSSGYRVYLVGERRPDPRSAYSAVGTAIAAAGVRS